MDLVTVLSFIGVSMLLTLMPGPDNMFVLAQSIAQNKRAGIITTLGLCTGLIVHITAATAGISAIIYQSTLAFSIIKYAGAAYLLFLAYKSFRDKNASLNLNQQNTSNYTALYRRGIIMNLLNPKVSLFFLALFPQFVNYSSGYVSVQMIVYGMIVLVETLLIFSLISIFAEKAGHVLRRSPTIARKMNLIQGSLFTLIGLKIAFSQK
ncbi:MAG: LysE family translocator [Candidatus Cohnella colombiensis]|uniref:LysE family translocator n=1 Tax=Candidatus Cohnella colombiensis TaxID=3121368 RepID=A0AA95EVW8_9BACL|nr:MAG: LysE family translocator [Cohnella sp.]